MKSNFKKFILLWVGELISSIGGGLTSFGLGVYIFRQTGSAAGMGLVTLLAFLPTLLLSVPAGVLADRYDRRLLMMLGDDLSGLGVLYILICMLGGEASMLEICIGVTISAVFSALLEPSYRATVTDLLTEDEYSKASGLVSLAGSARYLISPLIAGFLLMIANIELLLIIDIATFILTVITTGIVKKDLITKKSEDKESFMESFRGGWRAVTENKGVIRLIAVSSVMTLFMGTLQILSEPLVLSIADSTILGITETVCACGMLVSGLYLGIKGISKGYVNVLIMSLTLAGVFMCLFGIWENIWLLIVFGFAFFATLPFANNCLDYLVRTNIADDYQGRAWGLIGFLSQIGYVVAYGLMGVLADTIGKTFNIGVGRGAGAVIVVSGILLAITALMLVPMRSVRQLENEGMQS